MSPRSRSLVAASLLTCACGGATATVAPSPAPVDPAQQAANWHERMEAFRHMSDPTDEPEAVDKTVWQVPIGLGPVRGNALAQVTIVEMGDFQCGYCVRAEKTLAQIRATYGDAVRIVWKDDPLPFHERANAAAELAREARTEKGDAGFWAAHDALLSARADLSEAGLEAMAKSLGFDPAKALEAIAQNRYEDAIGDDLELAEDVGADGTPTFFVNGRRIVGAQPFEAWKPLLDEEIVHAKALLAKGTTPAALYDTLIQGGQVAPEPRTVKLDVPLAAPFRGDPNGTVVIQEFADFQCPYCSRAEEVLQRVLARHGSQVKLVWRDLPLSMHPNAELAAEAAAEAKKQKGNAGFWAMHDKLLASPGVPHALEKPALMTYASQLGLDTRAFEKALDSRTHAAEVTTDAKAAVAVDIHGTPAFIVGGYVLDGAQSYVRFRKWIRRVAEAGQTSGKSAKPAAQTSPVK